MGVAKGSDEYRSNIDLAVSYLVGHYDSHVGLIYESEDNGTHWLGPWATYRNTYWLYSDNLEDSSRFKEIQSGNSRKYIQYL